jgi:primase-polymerase (primpol)-like protein
MPTSQISRLGRAGSKRDARVNGDAGGVGIVLGGLGEGTDLYLCGLDLDSCLDETGTIALWAADIIAAALSYAEISPSGRGL